MALGLCISFIDLSTRRNIEQTPISMLHVHVNVQAACPHPCVCIWVWVCVCVCVCNCINARMSDYPAADQSGTGLKKPMPYSIFFGLMD